MVLHKKVNFSNGISRARASKSKTLNQIASKKAIQKAIKQKTKKLAFNNKNLKINSKLLSIWKKTPILVTEKILFEKFKLNLVTQFSSIYLTLMN